MAYRQKLQAGLPTHPEEEPQEKISPEMLQALAQHLTKIQKPTPLCYGPYKLHPLPPQKAFLAKEPVGPYEQCLLDYAWNAKNRAQLTMSLQALAWYFNNHTTTHKALTKPDEVAGIKLEPNLPNKKLEGELYDLKVSNIMLEDKLKGQEETLRAYEELQAYINNKEKYEQAVSWKQYPMAINEGRRHIRTLLYGKQLATQINLQKLLRQLSTSPGQLIKGLTFKASTYKGQDGFRGCSYVTVAINMEAWEPCTFEGINITLKSLFENGVVHKIILTKKSQVAQIPEERLFSSLLEVMSNNEGRIITAELYPVPPSYHSEALDETRAIVLLKLKKRFVQNYVPLTTDGMVSEDAVDIQDQIQYYRSIALKAPVNMLHYFLIAADHQYKIYAEEDWYVPFANQKTAFPGEVMYFQKVQMANHLCEEGDNGHSFPTPCPSPPSDSLENVLDDVGMTNLENSMSA